VKLSRSHSLGDPKRKLGQEVKEENRGQAHVDGPFCFEKKN